MYERIERDEVLAVIKRYGPLIPLDVKRKLGKGETTMIGAVLSELAHHKRVAISKVKRGGSPFYYDPSQPATLERAAQYLGEKDKATFDFLREARVVDPQTLEPITRVGLDQIQDYSKAFEYEGKKYYRYYLISEEEAKQLLQKPKEEAKPTQKEQEGAPQKDTQEPIPSSQQEKNQKEASSEKTREEVPSNQEQKNFSEQKKPTQKPAPKKIPTANKQTQTTFKNTINLDDEFFETIQQYCKEKNILIQQAELIRKNSELDLILRIPSAIGRLTYYAKAKSKKKSNDGDVAAALLTGQTKRLPTIYLTTGEVTKKAKEMTKKELRGVIIKEI